MGVGGGGTITVPDHYIFGTQIGRFHGLPLFVAKLRGIAGIPIALDAPVNADLPEKRHYISHSYYYTALAMTSELTAPAIIPPV